MNVVNIAAYKFVTLQPDALPQLRDHLKAKAFDCQLKGTILLSHEGINLNLAGAKEGIEGFKKILADHLLFSDLQYKTSVSNKIPFRKLSVRIKNEIITMKCDEIQPEQQTSDHLSPETFKQWYDEKREMIVIDTRNRFEIEMGAFENAIDFNLKSFSEFPMAVEALPSHLKDKAIVMYCTGGIRCEKASTVLLQKGFKNVYQLEGGILNYFEKCGGAFYHGECFVFDERIALNADLQELESERLSPETRDRNQRDTGDCS
jgi:UPF0176 protein